MSDVLKRRAASIERGHHASRMRLAVVSLCVLGTGCVYAACVSVILNGGSAALFSLVPWLAAGALLSCALVALSAVQRASRERWDRGRRGPIVDLLATLPADIAAMEISERAQAKKRLLNRLDVTRDVLTEVLSVNPAAREQLIVGGVAARVERELIGLRRKWHRVSAAGVLGLLGAESSIEALGRTLGNPDPDVAYAAAQALSRYDSPRAYTRLLDALGGDEIPAARIAGLLEAFSCPAARELIEERAGADDPYARYWSAYLLGRLGDPGSAPVVERLARDVNEDVRANAAEALASFPNEPLLRRLLADDSWVVRSHAAKAVGEGRQSELAPPLALLLQDSSWWVRQNAMLALANLGEQAVPALLAQLRSGDRFARNKAAEALIRSGYATEQLARLERGGAGSATAQRFLVDLGRAEALKTIEIAARAAPDGELRMRLISVLRSIGSDEAERVARELAGGDS
jgi:HEAT repeat protein